MNQDGPLIPRYRVIPTKKFRKQGLELGITEKERLRIIRDLQDLKFWPDNSEDFTFERVNEAMKFDFNTAGHWVRVFGYFDDDRKEIWLIKVMAKKANKLTVADLVSLDVAVRSVKLQIDQKRQKEEKKKRYLELLNGGGA